MDLEYIDRYYLSILHHRWLNLVALLGVSPGITPSLRSLASLAPSGCAGGQPVLLEGKTPVGCQANLGGSKIHQEPLDTHGKM